MIIEINDTEANWDSYIDSVMAKLNMEPTPALRAFIDMHETVHRVLHADRHGVAVENLPEYVQLRWKAAKEIWGPEQ
jgi:hypothetical protein